MNMCKYACVCHGFIWNVGPLDDLICYILLCSASCLPVTVYCHDLRSMCLYIYIYIDLVLLQLYTLLCIHACTSTACITCAPLVVLGSASLTAHFHVCTCIHTYIHTYMQYTRIIDATIRMHTYLHVFRLENIYVYVQ